MRLIEHEAQIRFLRRWWFDIAFLDWTQADFKGNFKL